MSNQNAIVIFNHENAPIEIRQDSEGRFCLNDLHKASGGESRHRPNYWLSLDSTKDLIAAMAAIDDESGIAQNREILSKQGLGTFVCAELAYAYTTWLSVEFRSWFFKNVRMDVKKLFQALSEIEIPDDLPDMFVYAIRNTVTGNLKLGISRDPRARLEQLQTGNDCRLELVAYRRAENRFKDERALHNTNAPLRISGEWFEASARF